MFPFRSRAHRWDPKNQRPELWSLYNGRVNKGESIRVFPLSNWTELDVWLYIALEKIPVVPLYFAAERPVVERDEFIEIFVNTPLAVCEQRDPKGLYRKARRGDLKNFTGLDSPYEAPENPELVLDTLTSGVDELAEQVIGMLEQRQ